MILIQNNTTQSALPIYRKSQNISVYISHISECNRMSKHVFHRFFAQTNSNKVQNEKEMVTWSVFDDRIIGMGFWLSLFVGRFLPAGMKPDDFHPKTTHIIAQSLYSRFIRLLLENGQKHARGHHREFQPISIRIVCVWWCTKWKC